MIKPKPEFKRRAHGTEYEQKAADYLEKIGYRLIAKNANYKCGEIDLIAEETTARGVILVFVEVRKRDPAAGITPEETITFRKQRRLQMAIQLYLLKYRGSAQRVRIDLVAFWGEELRHRRDFVGI
jgi:putative endonuclease